ncbi:MAG TPA: hypothetical protein VGB53_05335 [Rubricoccaceae bacterium]|jgi:hypothetical protein
MRLPLLALALLALPACDSQYDNGYDDGYYDGQGTGTTTAGARFVDFSLDPAGYQVSADSKTAGYESDDIDSGTTRASVERALATAGDGALVMLYIRSNLVNLDFGGESEPYSALPLSRSFDEIVLQQGPNGTTTTVPVVGYTASYEFSFDNGDLYFDVVSSAPATDFGANPTDFFDAIIPQRRVADGTPQALTPLRLRLVTVPATAAKQGVDMTDYAAVARAYGLPD